MDEFYEQLQEQILHTGKNYDLEKIRQAYEYAKELHEGQYRASGEPYISHPDAVAQIVVELELDTDSVCAALLHDTVEDCADKTDVKALRAKFGDTVGDLVDGLTKLVHIPFADKEEESMENLRKMLLAMSRDVRVILIKLCDRLHNMRTLSAKPEDKQRLTALETMNVYAPLAHRLGMQRIRQELENLALSYLDPIGFAEVSGDIEKKYGQNKDFIERTKEKISEKLTEYHIPFKLKGRVKSVYSIYRKMYNQNKSFDEIYDFYALRIIVETELECYTALGIIHDMFRSMPGRFKDYISTPKPNMYRSLHTTVLGRDGVPFEVQIRTREMDQVAEYGVAAHWKYKSGETGSKDQDQKLEWIARLLETENDTNDPDEFVNALKIDIFQDETFVFTPKGDVISLPQGSTCIDFAYAIHSAVGHKMVGAKVNGMIVPIDRVLQTGEIVEVITSAASKGPSRDWLKIVKTSEARNKIRQFFKKERRADNIIVGRNDVERELKRLDRRLSDEDRTQVVQAVAQRAGFHEVDDLYNMVGYGGLPTSKLTIRLKEEIERCHARHRAQNEEETPAPVSALNKQQQHTPHVSRSSAVVVDGVDGCQVKFAKCCNPLPGDDIVGFVTKGFGISIHKRDCANVAMLSQTDRQRLKEAHWTKQAQLASKEVFEGNLHILTHDEIGVMASIMAVLADMRVSATQITTQMRENGVMAIYLTVTCKNVEHLHAMMARLRGVEHVIEVKRG